MWSHSQKTCHRRSGISPSLDQEWKLRTSLWGPSQGPRPRPSSYGPSPGLDLGLRQRLSSWDFVVATEREFEEVLAISGGIYGGLDYLPSRYHSWLRDPNDTVVLAKHSGGVVRTGAGGPGEKG